MLRFISYIVSSIFFFNILNAQSDSENLKFLSTECEKGNQICCKLLNIFALSYPEYYIRKDAAQLITNQDILKHIIKYDDSWIVQKAAITNLTDQKLLYKLSTKGSDGIRAVAVTNLINQEQLAKIARKDKITSVRESATRRIDNKDILYKIARNDNEYRVRVTAIKKIINSDKLLIEDIDDDNFLNDIVSNDYDRGRRLSALKKIENQEILLGIVNSDNYKEIRLVSLNRLDVTPYYKNILNIAGNPKKYFSNLRQIAGLKALNEDKLLNRIYGDFEINIQINVNTKVYKNELQNYTIGVWRRLIYTITVKKKTEIQRFIYKGKEGGFIESSDDIKKLHLAHIKTDEICEYLLSSLNESDLIEISTESDVSFLRDYAKRIINQ